MRAAVEQTWPPFALVTGLLLLGLVAADDGLFAWAGARLERLPGPPAGLLAASLALVAATTAILNLDTAVVFLTPILVLAARHRGTDEAPFLYGTVFVANASSLFLPGSNLTNLLVVHGNPGEQGRFAAALLPAAVAATVVTIGLLLLLERRRLRAAAVVRSTARPVPAPRTLGAVGAGLAGVAVVVLPAPALPVLGLGLAIAAIRVVQGRLGVRAIVRGVDPLVLAALFAFATVLGALARTWSAPGDLVRTASAPVTAAVAALMAVAVNNLPATMLLTAAPIAHPRALLLGLNVGPNLAVTGSLAAYLWWKAARSVGSRPSARAFTQRGIVLAPAAIAAGLAATALLATSTLSAV